MPALLAASLVLMLAADPVPPEGVVVDQNDRPLAGVEVFLSVDFSQEPDGCIPVLERTATDAEGRFRLAAPPVTAFKTIRSCTIWAYKPGFGIEAADYHRDVTRDPARIQLRPGIKEVVTLKTRDGLPVSGVKVAPRQAIAPNGRGRKGVSIPDAIAERLAVATDSEGKATLADLSSMITIGGLLVSSPRIGSQTVFAPVGAPAQPRQGPAVAIVDLAGAMTGRVVRGDGQSAEGLIVRVYIGTRRGGVARPVSLSAGPIRIGKDGTFKTPPALLSGQDYRVLVRAEGLEPTWSDWVEPPGEGKTAAIPPIVMAPLLTVSGRVIDRQGRPIVGAEIIQSGDGPERTTTRTDASGRYRLGGFREGPSLVFARAEGFRFGGRMVAAGDNTVTLTRIAEAPAQAMPPLPPPLSQAEMLTLARRVLEPSLDEVLKLSASSVPAAQATMLENEKFRAIVALAAIDPNAAAERLPEAKLSTTEDMTRRAIATAMARNDIQGAAAFAATIHDPSERCAAFTGIAHLVPKDQRVMKLALLDKALASARAGDKAERKMYDLGDVGERLVELGEVEKAKPLFAEALAIAETISPASYYRRLFTARLAHVDLPAAIRLIEAIPSEDARSTAFDNAAHHLAATQPEACERLLGYLKPEKRHPLTVCERMAAVDPVRARRLADSFPVRRGVAQLAVAHGLAKRSREEANRVFREALVDLDADLADNPVGQRSQILMLPIVDEIDPALVPEFLWRVLAARPAGAEGESASLAIHQNTEGALVAARYDRALAAYLFAPIAARERPRSEKPGAIPDQMILDTQARIDPLAAVEWVESFPRPETLELKGQNNIRFIIATRLAEWARGYRGRDAVFRTFSLYEYLTDRDTIESRL